MLHDLDLGWGKGHSYQHTQYMWDYEPSHVTAASHSTEIWPFEFREILTIGEV